MKKKDFAVLAAALTPEERDSMERINKSYTRAVTVCAMVGAVIALVLFAYFRISVEHARLMPLGFVIGGSAALVGIIAVMVFFHVKYPFFSEKLYNYIKNEQNSDVKS